ncbi:hypothetical protein ACH47B_06655 [Rhodococcus sp. NPDC019627]|uniref:hypothetical protein n=1 Tax=unclassified Rhodococcus (in: high G+C Gram-positive bacteria) TaxID=192944 RepID=UPI0037B6974F
MGDQIAVFCLGGTSETFEGDERTVPAFMLSNAARLLDSTRFRGEWVPYPAVYGTSMPYNESVRRGLNALLERIRLLDGAPFVMWGYSQGCDVVRAAAMYLRLESINPNCRGVGMLADPGRDPNQFEGMAVKPEGYGIRGGWRVDDTHFPVWSLSAQGDPISSLPGGNPLRSIADLTATMGVSTQSQRLEWFGDVVEKITAGQMQPWWSLERWRDWAGALAFARGYAIDGRHTCYATERVPGRDVTYTQRLAQLTNALPL